MPLAVKYKIRGGEAPSDSKAWVEGRFDRVDRRGGI